MADVVEVWRQLFDARVSGVDDEDVIASVDCDAAWLHESFLFGATCSKHDLQSIERTFLILLQRPGFVQGRSLGIKFLDQQIL